RLSPAQAKNILANARRRIEQCLRWSLQGNEMLHSSFCSAVTKQNVVVVDFIPAKLANLAQACAGQHQESRHVTKHPDLARTLPNLGKLGVTQDALARLFAARAFESIHGVRHDDFTADSPFEKAM